MSNADTAHNPENRKRQIPWGEHHGDQNAQRFAEPAIVQQFGAWMHDPSVVASRRVLTLPDCSRALGSLVVD